MDTRTAGSYFLFHRRSKSLLHLTSIWKLELKMPFLIDCLILIVAGCYISAFLIVIYEATMNNLAYSNIGDDTPAPPAQISQEEYEMELRHQDQMARALGADSTRERNYIVRQDSVDPEAVAQDAPKAPEAGPIQEAPKSQKPRRLQKFTIREIRSGVVSGSSSNPSCAASSLRAYRTI